jgi:uncharacterized RDD family membrane protein YckC
MVDPQAAVPGPFERDEYAFFLRRAVSLVIDASILAVVTFAVLVAIPIAQGGELHHEGLGMLLTWLATGVVWDTLWIAGPSRGRPGNRMLGFRIVRPDGSRVSMGRAAGRSLVKAVTYVFLAVGLVAQAVAIYGTPRRQGVHDLFADTVAVDADALERIGSVQHVPRRSEEPIAPAPPAHPTAPSPVQRDDDADRHRGPFL